MYENIDQLLPNKLHGPMHYEICDTCVYNGQWTRVLYSVVITRQSNPPIPQFNSPCNDSRVSGQCLHTINNTEICSVLVVSISLKKTLNGVLVYIICINYNDDIIR